MADQFAPNHKLCYRCQGSGRERGVFYGKDPGDCMDCGGKGVVFKGTPTNPTGTPVVPAPEQWVIDAEVIGAAEDEFIRIAEDFDSHGQNSASESCRARAYELKQIVSRMVQANAGVRALPAPRVTRAADPSEPDTKIAQREGYDEGWNDCLKAVATSRVIDPYTSP